MSDSLFDPNWFKSSDYPSDFIPAGAVVIVRVDISTDGDCTAKGFYDLKTGEYHIQEIMHNLRKPT